jgi:hypothetical protein
MKGFYIEELNKAVVTTNKSGSLLILNSFFEFCKIKKLKYVMLDDCYDSIKDTAEFNIFVRNPIDRFITTFYWFLKNHTEATDIFGNKPIDKLFTINNFVYFFENYFDIIRQTNYDFHIAPQKFHLLETSNDNIFVNQKITDSLIKKKYPNYNIVQIEEFEKKVSNIILNDHQTFLWDIKDININYSFEINTNISIIKDLKINDIKLLYSCFLLSEKYLNMKHHNKPSLKLTRNIEKSLHKLFADEIKIYGYPNIKSLL